MERLSPAIISFYQEKDNQWKLVRRIKERVLPLMPDSAMAAQELYDLVLQAPNVPPQKKMELTDGYTFEDENDEATEVYYNAKDSVAEVYTHDTNLKKRMHKYAEKYPELCQLTDD